MPSRLLLTAAPDRPADTALLVFARTATTELGARGWPRQLAPLLDPARCSRALLTGVEVHCFTDGSCAESLAAGAETGAAKIHRQSGGDFGARLRGAVQTLAACGYERIVIVGSDCPDLRPEDVARAAALLRSVDAVLGPDHRGGMYLIGIRTADRALLDAVVWQRNTDCDQLRALYAGRRVEVLPVRIDLDRWHDLRLFARLDGALQRWLAQQLAWLFSLGVSARTVFWVNLARQSELSRLVTSPPVANRP